MDSERWDRMQTLFHETLTRPESDWRLFLESACGGDGSLTAEVLAMLEVDRRSASLLDRGLSDLAGTAFDPVFAREFGPYRLIRILGEGGMGVVWLAERTDAGNPVAIKFLPHAALSPARRERFAREIKTLANLKHPFIARLYDAGTLSDGTPWFVMEYVEGTDFARYDRESSHSLKERLHVFRSVCEAVQYLHGQGIIHRDLKPSNIMVAEGTPRLLDFGIAKELQHPDEAGDATRLGLRFLSRGYAAPEWARDGIAGTATDVYSLGVILHEMLAARHDSGISQAAWDELEVLCRKAMHQDAAERYKSVEALIRDIDHYLKGEPLDARPDSWRYRAGKFVGRNRGAVFGSAAAFALVACMIVLFAVRLAKERNSALAQSLRRDRIQRFMLNLFQGDDKEAGPAGDLRVITLIDRGVQEARSLSREPEVQAELYLTLGTMYRKLGKLDRADGLLQLSLKERESLPKPDYPAVVDSLIALGLLRSDQGQAKEALRMVHEALTVTKSHDAANKSLLANANFALGEVLVDSGKYAEGAEILNQVVAFRSAESAASPELAKSLGALADADVYLGHYESADLVSRRALAIDREIYGGDHPEASEELGRLAQIQALWGHFAEAEKYGREALAISEAWFGRDHPDTAGTMTTLASTLHREGRGQEADELLKQALAVRQRVYGAMHPKVAYVLNSMGGLALGRKDYKAAEEDFRRTTEIYRSAYGDGDYRVGVGIANLGSVYFAEKRYALAERVFRDAVLRQTKALSADNINTGEDEIKLGRTLLREGRYREAEQYTRTGYQVLLKQTSPSTSFVEGARKDLAVICEALGRHDEAQGFRTLLAAASAPVHR